MANQGSNPGSLSPSLLAVCHQGQGEIQRANCCCCWLVPKLCPFFATPWTVARQAPLSMGFPRQEYWSGLPFPSLGDLPDPGMEPMSPALAGGFFTTSTTMVPQEWMFPNFVTCLFIWIVTFHFTLSYLP